MNDRVRRLLAGSLLAIAVAACASAGTPATTPSASPTATGPAVFAIRTPQMKPQACMDALIIGRLARNVASGLGITGTDGRQTPVEWPFGYAAREDGGRVTLFDETGKVVAREGDEISMGGGFGNQFWHGCGPVTVTKPA